jgi:hypothetical protein
METPTSEGISIVYDSSSACPFRRRIVVTGDGWAIGTLEKKPFLVRLKEFYHEKRKEGLSVGRMIAILLTRGFKNERHDPRSTIVLPPPAGAKKE